MPCLVLPSLAVTTAPPNRFPVGGAQENYGVM
jgi:hypothetical protein